MRMITFLAALMVSRTIAAACVADASVRTLKSCRNSLTVLVGVTPGGASDVFARELSKFSKQFDLNVMVINKAGASGNIASGELVRDTNNDCKFMMGTAASLFLNKFNDQLIPKIDPETTFQPIGLVATNPMFLAVNLKKINVKSIDEFIVRTSTRAPFYSTPGIGSSNHLMVLKIDETMRRPNHSTHIPAKGASEALGLLLAGEVEFVLDNPSTLRTTIGNPDIRFLGNTSLSERTLNGVTVPPLSSSAKLAGIEGYSAFGLVANSRISMAHAKAMENVLRCLVSDADFKRTYSGQGYDIKSGRAAELSKLTIEQLKYWRPIAALAFSNNIPTNSSRPSESLK